MRILAILLAAVVVLGGAAAGGGYWYLTSTLSPKPVPPEALAAEAALALPGAVGFMHFNVRQAVEAERIFLGEEDRDALLDPFAAQGDMLQILLREGIEPRDVLDHVFGVAVLEEDTVGTAAVLLGNFPEDRIRDALAESHRIEPVRWGETEALLLTRQDPDSCLDVAPFAMVLTAQRILFGDPGVVQRLVPRFATAADPEMELEAWRNYRKDKVFSLALFVPPKDVLARIEDPMTRMVTRGMENNMAPVEAVYFGSAIEAVPPALMFDLRIDTQDSNWVAVMESGYQSWREELDQEAAKSLPSVALIMDRLSVVAKGTRLQASARLDRSVLQDVGRLPMELVQALFAGFGSKSATEEPISPEQEKTVPQDKVAQFSAAVSHGGLKPFDPEVAQNFEADVTSGPFGVRLEAARLSEPKGEENPPELVELEFSVSSSGIPNIGAVGSGFAGSSEGRGRIFVSRIANSDGENLLRDEPCGPNRNSLGGALSTASGGVFVDNEFVWVPVLKGTRGFRLKPGAALTDITRIEGSIRLNLPTATRTLRLTAPLEGQVVEVAGMRVRFDDGGPNGVKFEVSGEVDRLLDVRALNGAGAYLASAGSYSSGRLLGAGKTVGKDFQGQPASVEVVVADQITEADYPFSLESALPGFDQWDFPVAFTVAAAKRTSLAKDLAAADQSQVNCAAERTDPALKPFRVCVQWMRPSWGDSLQGGFSVAGPNSPALAGNLSAVALSVEGLQVAGSEALVEVAHSDFVALSNAYGSPDVLQENPYLTVQGVEGQEEATIEKVQGRLILRLPKKLARFTLDVTKLGSSAADPSGLSARLVEIGGGGLKLEITGPRERLVQFVPRDEEGTALATNAVDVDAQEEGEGWTASLRVSGRPATLDIVYAEAQEVAEFPFTVPVVQ